MYICTDIVRSAGLEEAKVRELGCTINLTARERTRGAGSSERCGWFGAGAENRVGGPWGRACIWRAPASPNSKFAERPTEPTACCGCNAADGWLCDRKARACGQGSRESAKSARQGGADAERVLNLHGERCDTLALIDPRLPWRECPRTGV